MALEPKSTLMKSMLTWWRESLRAEARADQQASALHPTLSYSTPRRTGDGVGTRNLGRGPKLGARHGTQTRTADWGCPSGHNDLPTAVRD